MFAAAFAATGLEGWRYQRLPVPPGAFAETVRALPGAGFHGINVTVPHKTAALAVAGAPSAAARAIGAANVLTLTDGTIGADNTDAPGLLEVIPTPVVVRGCRAVILGAGGSARAAAWALLDAGAADVAVHNRTQERARELCDALGGGRPVDTVPASGDLLVNCTTVGLGDPDASPLPAGQAAGFGAVVDLVYGARATALARAAQSARVPVVDGLAVLVAQGALAFERWFDRPAPREAMERAARAGAG